jgi:hypothetical protein
MGRILYEVKPIRSGEETVKLRVGTMAVATVGRRQSWVSSLRPSGRAPRQVPSSLSPFFLMNSSHTADSKRCSILTWKDRSLQGDFRPCNRLVRVSGTPSQT